MSGVTALEESVRERWLDEGVEDAEGGDGGGDVVDAEDVDAAEGACGEARDGAGVAVQRVRESEGVADDGFAADGEEDGSVEAEETGAVVEDGEIVRRLLGEVDARVEDDLVWEETGGGGGGDAVGEEGVEFGHDVGPRDVRVFFFGEPD